MYLLYLLLHAIGRSWCIYWFIVYRISPNCCLSHIYCSGPNCCTLYLLCLVVPLCSLYLQFFMFAALALHLSSVSAFVPSVYHNWFTALRTCSISCICMFLRLWLYLLYLIYLLLSLFLLHLILYARLYFCISCILPYTAVFDLSRPASVSPVSDLSALTSVSSVSDSLLLPLYYVPKSGYYPEQDFKSYTFTLWIWWDRQVFYIFLVCCIHL